MNIEELKEQAKLAKKRKQMEKAKEDPSSIRDGDVLLVLHLEEVALIGELMFNILENGTPKKQRIALNILKHMEVI